MMPQYICPKAESKECSFYSEWRSAFLADSKEVIWKHADNNYSCRCLDAHDDPDACFSFSDGLAKQIEQAGLEETCGLIKELNKH